MASSTLSILGLYRWAEKHDIDLFSELTLPEGMEKDVLINNILMQASPFEILYPDPEVLQDAIGIWSEASQDKWTRWLDAWLKAAEFNPLENFDRTEEEQIQHSGTDASASEQTRNLAGTDNRTQNLTDAETRNLSDTETRNLSDTENRSHSEELKVSAYDSSAYQPKEQRTGSDSLNASHTGTDTNTHTGTDNITHTGTDNRQMSDTGTVADEGTFTHGHKVTRSARYHGNIGVTSLAQLLTSYDAAAEDWDLYAKITQDFIKEFCVMVF